MALVDLVMPKMGESIMEATILKWYKNPGDAVKLDEPVLEIATDKVDSEVPSTIEGVLEETLYNVNDVVPVGAVIARIRSNVAESITPHEEVTYTPPPATNGYEAHGTTTQNGRFFSPLVLNIATSEGVSMSELEKITGTGNEGRVTKKDILQYVADK